LEALEGLLEIDDVDAAALAEDEPLHLRVPAARLVAEVHSGFQKLSHADDCHGLSPFLLVFAALLPAETGWNRASSAPAPPPSRPAGSVVRKREWYLRAPFVMGPAAQRFVMKGALRGRFDCCGEDVQAALELLVGRGERRQQ